jgi:GTP pyrophosphokinase
MTATATANYHGNDKMKTAKAFLETATPHRVPLWGTILSRKGRGNNDHGKIPGCHSAWSVAKRSGSAESLYAVFLFVVVVIGRSPMPPEGGRPLTASPFGSRPLPQEARERHDHGKIPVGAHPSAPFYKRGMASRSGKARLLFIKGGLPILYTGTMKDLMESLSYLPIKSVGMILKAYEYASWAHSYQVRVSGAPYLTHLVAAAQNLAELRADAASIAAALLHDVLEDTLVVEAELEEEFGKEIVNLVKGVTKLNKYSFDDTITEQAENWKKMLLAIVQDPRVILIKIADRLHNMRTINYLSEAKQKKIANETLTLYAPFAHRLGIYKWRNELEDLSFAILYPQEFNDIKTQLAARVQSNTDELAKVEDQIKKLIDPKIPFRIFSRPKNLYGIYKKMERQKKPFSEIEDIFGLRLITDSVENCYTLLGIINSNFESTKDSFTDYINVPKNNMYQSLHITIISQNKIVIETQIRTEDMHQRAEYGIAAHWLYKAQSAGAQIKSVQGESSEHGLDWLKQFLQGQAETKDSQEFIESLKTECNFSQIFVFTPKNKVIKLPAGSTTLDFAYAIHSDIGESFMGAKVNGKMKNINTVLKTGDVCEILTRKNIKPSADWIKYVHSPQSIKKIKRYLQDNKIK